MDIDTSHRPKRKKNSQIQSQDLLLHIKKKSKLKRLSIPRLTDAYAAGRFSETCTLILTIGGDSVRAFAKKGILSLKEQGHYGVFPLHKLLNVREASHKQIMEDIKIQRIKQIIGLEDGKVYDESVNSLRYCHLIIMMTNQEDREGTLIKGLFINFIRFFWPSLLKIPYFLMEVYTPNNIIVKELVSYTKKKEAMEWLFQNLKTHLRYFTWVDETDGDAIDMTFSEKIEERKTWSTLKFDNWFNHEKNLIRYRDFVTEELMCYSLVDSQRYIPSIVDGLNEVQRTILCCAFEHDLGTQIYISQFLPLLKHSAYHYDVDRLTGAIIGMVSDFVGSNNLNLFSQNWGRMFGTGLQGSKDHDEATQYLCTSLTPIARLLFPKEDDILYMNEDGQLIQPTWYAPVLPLVLMNGCQEFGIGWSTSVPSYNPKELCAKVRCLLNDEPIMVPIDPWYKGFQGTIERNGAASYTTSGKIECIDDTTLRITELPVHTWTEYYKEFLDTLSTCTGEMEEPFIKSYRNHSDDTIVQFEINISKENMEQAVNERLMYKFKLTTPISTDNMCLYDAQGMIKKYDNLEQILKDFYVLRLPLYEKRKEMTLKYLELELFKLEFNWEVLNVGMKNFTGWLKKDVLLSLGKRDLLTLFQKTSQAGGDLDEERFGRFYNHLCLIDFRISKEMFESRKENLSTRVNELKNSSPKDLWRNDLTVFENKLEKLELELKKAKEDIELWKLKMEEAAMAVEEATPVGSLMDVDNVSKIVKPPPKGVGVGGGRKAPTEKQQNPTVVDSNEDGEILAGKETSRTLHQAKGLHRSINPQLDDHSDKEFGVGVELPQPLRKDVE